MRLWSSIITYFFFSMIRMESFRLRVFSLFVLWFLVSYSDHRPAVASCTDRFRQTPSLHSALLPIRPQGVFSVPMLHRVARSRHRYSLSNLRCLHLSQGVLNTRC